MGRRLLVMLGIGSFGALVLAAMAFATLYAGPKTWYQGWDQDGPWDTAQARWDWNGMGPKSDDACYPNCSSRVTFIDTSSGWTYSHTDSLSWTETSIPSGSAQAYTKKPYCRNNSSDVYTAACEMWSLSEP